MGRKGYVLLFGKVHDPEMHGDYVSKFGPTLGPFGGKLLLKHVFPEVRAACSPVASARRMRPAPKAPATASAPTLADAAARCAQGPAPYAERTTADDYTYVVALEFDSVEKAMEWKSSAAYQEIVNLRLDASTGPLIVAEGADSEADGLPMIEDPQAFLCGYIKITDPAMMGYPPKVPATLAGFGGYVMRAIFPKGGGAYHERTTKEDFDLGIILGFTSVEKALEWKASAAYQEILPIRLDNSTGPLAIVPKFAPPS